MLRRRSLNEFLWRGVPQNDSADIIDVNNGFRQSNLFSKMGSFKMHRSARIALIGFGILVCILTGVFIVVFGSSREEICVELNGNEACLSTNPKPYRFYGTKTAYHIATEKKSDASLPLNDCTPKIFYMLSRHATRHPDKEQIQELNSVLPLLKKKIIVSYALGKAKICSEDLEKLKLWQPNLDPENGNAITATGKLEAEHLAQRLRKRFPSILDVKYTSKKFIFEYTSKDRTRTTAEAFAEGLFGNESKKIKFEGNTNDEVLAFHTACKDLKKPCPDPSYDTLELKKFTNGTLMKKVVESISERVGFPLSKEEVKVMRVACVFGFALNSSDIWCSLFSTDELKVIEFDDDIDDYYKDAYGNKINYEQACPVVKYIVDLFRLGQKSNDTKAIFHFSHSGGLKKVYAAFGLFKDKTPLTADGFCSLSERKWRSSLILPFNSNIVFVLYQCKEQQKLAAFHNENLIQVQGCGSDFCPIQDFYSSYETISENCDISEICKCKI